MIDTRAQTMRDYGLYECPDWCTQPDDEDQHEQHVGEWSHLELSEATVRVRPRMAWTTDGADQVDVEILDADGAPCGRLTLDEWRQVEQLVSAAEGEMDDHDTTWAYDGAEEDAAVLNQAA